MCILFKNLISIVVLKIIILYSDEHNKYKIKKNKQILVAKIKNSKPHVAFCSRLKDIADTKGADRWVNCGLGWVGLSVLSAASALMSRQRRPEPEPRSLPY